MVLKKQLEDKIFDMEKVAIAFDIEPFIKRLPQFSIRFYVIKPNALILSACINY